MMMSLTLILGISFSSLAALKMDYSPIKCGRVGEGGGRSRFGTPSSGAPRRSTRRDVVQRAAPPGGLWADLAPMPTLEMPGHAERMMHDRPSGERGSARRKVPRGM